MTNRVAFCAALYEKSTKPSKAADKSKFGRIWDESGGSQYGCLFACQNKSMLGHFRRVDIIAGGRVGVANAPLPDSHRTATPTVSRFLAILKVKFLGFSIGHQES